MPRINAKTKTKIEAKKRFRVRPGGTVKRSEGYKRYILTKKSVRKKRQTVKKDRDTTVEPNDPWPNPRKVNV